MVDVNAKIKQEEDQIQKKSQKNEQSETKTDKINNSQTNNLKNEKKKADEAKPKKPQTAYQYYTLEFKANFKQQNPKSTVKMAEVTAQCAQSWAVLTDKVKYESKALEDKKK